MDTLLTFLGMEKDGGSGIVTKKNKRSAAAISDEDAEDGSGKAKKVKK